MSKQQGPTNYSRRKKINRKQETKASQSARQAHTQSILERVIPPSLLGNPSRAILGQSTIPVFDITALSQQMSYFCNAAKEQIAAKRINDTQQVIQQNPFFKENSVHSIIGILKIHINHQTVNYLEVLTSLEQVKATNNTQEILKRTVETEKQLLMGFENANIWHALLTQWLPLTSNENEQYAPTREKIIDSLFFDLTQATPCLGERFILGTLHEYNYYSYYHILIEKYEWLTTYFEEYQKYLLSELETQNKPAELNLIQEKINSLLMCYNKGIALLHCINHPLREDLARQASGFIDLLSSSVKVKTDEQSVSELIKLSAQPSIIITEWILLFTFFEQFFEKVWTKCDKMDWTSENLEMLERQIKEHIELIKRPDSTIGIFELQKLLMLSLSSFRSIPNELLNAELLTSALTLTMTYINYLESKVSSSNEKFNILCVQGIIKEIANELVKLNINLNLQKKIVESKVVPQEVKSSTEEVPQAFDDCLNEKDVDFLCQAFSEALQLSIDQPKATELEDLHELEQQLALEREKTLQATRLQNELTLQEEKSQHEMAKARIIANHQKQLEQEKALLTQTLEQKRQEIKESKEKEELALQQRLAQENKVILDEIERSNSAILSSLKAQSTVSYKKFAKRKESQLVSKRKKLEGEHLDNLSTMRSQYEQMRKDLQEANQNSLNDLTAEHKRAEIELKLQLQTKHDQLKQNLEQKITVLKTKNQQSISALEAEHLQAFSGAQLNMESEYQSISKNLESESQQAIVALNLEHEQQLIALKICHQQQIQALKDENYKTRLQRQEFIQAEHNHIIEKLQLDHNQDIQSTLKAKSVQSIQGLTPIGSIETPTEYNFILQSLEEANIEFYPRGGFVRNRLLNIPSNISEDFDVIVNCNIEDVPEKIKKYAQPQPFLPNLLKLGKMDFWCEPWEDIALFLNESSDLSINTFICKKGDVYDVLGKKADLHAPYLVILGDLNQRLQDNPSLIWRILRFRTQLNKGISPDDWAIMEPYLPSMTCMSLGLYLNNLQKIFLNSISVLHFNYLYQSGLLCYLFPIFPINYRQCYPENSILHLFMKKKMLDFSIDVQNFTSDHVFALFILMPMIIKMQENSDLHEVLEYCIDHFFKNYQGKVEQIELNRMIPSLSAVMWGNKEFDYSGLFSEYKAFEQKCISRLRQQSKRVNSPTSESYTPGFNGQRLNRQNRTNTSSSETELKGSCSASSGSPVQVRRK